MEKLELKDIAVYLLYGMEFQRPDGKTILTACGNLWTLIMSRGEDNIEYSSLSGCKPILRNIADITKEITHKGQTFVPIVELAKIASRIYIKDFKVKHVLVEWCDVYTECGCSFGFNNDEFYFFHKTISGEEQLTINQYELFDKLNEWFFDYRGLIEKGLAIDVNTLENNPYEK